jgi:hypothetical protein
LIDHPFHAIYCRPHGLKQIWLLWGANDVKAIVDLKNSVSIVSVDIQTIFIHNLSKLFKKHTKEGDV